MGRVFGHLSAAIKANEQGGIRKHLSRIREFYYSAPDYTYPKLKKALKKLADLSGLDKYTKKDLIKVEKLIRNY